MSELDILIGDRIITLRDKKSITLRPCKVLQLRKILGLINKYVDEIAKNEDAIALAKFLLQDSGEQGLNDVFEVLKSCSNIGSKSESEQTSFFENLYYDELVLLVVKFLEMNKDFFATLGKKLTKAVNQDTAPHINLEPEALKTGESKLAA